MVKDEDWAELKTFCDSKELIRLPKADGGGTEITLYLSDGKQPHVAPDRGLAESLRALMADFTERMRVKYPE